MKDSAFRVLAGLQDNAQAIFVQQFNDGGADCDDLPRISISSQHGGSEGFSFASLEQAEGFAKSLIAAVEQIRAERSE